LKIAIFHAPPALFRGPRQNTTMRFGIKILGWRLAGLPDDAKSLREDKCTRFDTILKRYRRTHRQAEGHPRRNRPHYAYQIASQKYNKICLVKKTKTLRYTT